jgi:hypothetical protein
MSARTSLLALVALSALTLGACTGGDTDDLGQPVSDSTPDPCALLDPAAIADATGWTVAEGGPADEDAAPGLSGCHFLELDQIGVVQVVVADRTGSGPATSARRELAERHDDVVDVTVPGASDAFEARDLGVVGMVVDDRFVEVSAVGAGLDDQGHLQLAEAVVERM